MSEHTVALIIEKMRLWIKLLFNPGTRGQWVI